MDRFEAAPPPVAIVRADRRTREEAAPAERHPSRSMAGLIAFLMLGAAIVGLATFAASRDQLEWHSFMALMESAGRVAAPAPTPVAPVIREAPLPLPRRGETILARARALAAGGHLRDALALAESIRATDPQKSEADRLRADIQRQLLALTEVPTLAAPGEQVARRVR
jgi:hypothetical protein